MRYVTFTDADSFIDSPEKLAEIAAGFIANPDVPVTSLQAFPLPDTPTRDERIIRECLERGEPFFVFRAKDSFAPDVLDRYRLFVAGNAETASDPFASSIERRAAEFRDWQEAHPD